MYVSSIIGACCGIVVWVIVIGYFCVRHRSILTRDQLIIDKVIKLCAAEFQAEKELCDYYAQSKGNIKALYKVSDMQRTYRMKGRWAVEMDLDWNEENVRRWSDPSPVRVKLDDLESPDDMSVRSMGDMMFTPNFAKYLGANKVNSFDLPVRVASRHTAHAAAEDSDHIVPVELLTTSSRITFVPEGELRKSEKN